MAQITTGIRSILSHPTIYNIVQRIVGERKPKSTYINKHVKPFDGCRILDVGCGTGEMFPYVKQACSNVNYTGIDLSESYINIAQKKFGDEAKFMCMDVMDYPSSEPNSFDLVICAGFLHHIDDDTVIHLAQSAKKLLKDGGAFFAMEILYTPEQSKIARYLISKDRGQNVRTPDGYEKLLATEFSDITSTIYHDLHNIPYTNIVFECR